MGKASRRLRERKTRRVPLHPEVREAIQEQQRRFKDKFGREMGPGDPIFFDPAANTPKPFDLTKVEEGIVKAMIAADLPPEFIYAYRKTGLIASEANWDRLRPADRRAWQAAIGEYFAKTGVSKECSRKFTRDSD